MAYYQVNVRSTDGLFVEDRKYATRVWKNAKRALNTARRRAAQHSLGGTDAEIINAMGLVYSVEEVHRNAAKWAQLTDTQCG